MRSLASAAVLVGLIALIPAAASTAHAASAAAPPCATRSLVVWLDAQGNGAAGSTYYRLRFTNLGGQRCTLRGYPGVSAVDLAGRQLGTAARRNPQTPVRTVTVAPGQTVHAVLQINDVSVFPAATCRPVRAAGLRVFPPNTTQSKVVPFPFRACSRTGPAYLHVEAVAP